MSASSPIIILDAGPLKAALDRNDAHNAFAVREMTSRKGPFIVTSAAIAEATHLLKNHRPALLRLAELVGRMVIDDPSPPAVLAEMVRYAPEMDYADGCAILLAKRYRGACVLTTDHRDFSIYQVPFISPQGEFRE